jgi:hypothetical protein
MQGSDAPSWFAAAGTVAAVVVALWVALREGRRRRLEERRFQAELITAWVAFDDPEGKYPYVKVAVANASHQVVYRLVVSLGDASRGGFRPDAPLQWRNFVSQLPPGETLVDVDWTTGVSARPSVGIAFQDAAGRHWIREMSGKLVEVKDDHWSRSKKTDHLKKLGLLMPPESLPWDHEI